ncbi:MAG: hypothetical protein EA391_09250 [Balneolaceae bacterium]|nr:MAG: hypothetical protein EA391_09250 [Balneolaceae bacterium]
MLTLLFYWLIFIPNSSNELTDSNNAGNRIAIHIDAEGSLPTDEQFQLARSIGVDLIEIEDPTLLSSTALADFYILLSSDNKFVTPRQIKNNRDQLINLTVQRYRGFSSEIQNRIAAVSVLKYPADFADNFGRELSFISDSLSLTLNKPIYYQSAFAKPRYFPPSLGFISVLYQVNSTDTLPATPVIHFKPNSQQQRNSIKQFQDVLNASLRHETSLIIVPSEWFFQTIEDQPDLAILLSDHVDGLEIVFPLPADGAPAMVPNWHVILLFIIFIVLLLHYKYQPFFISFAGRYFFNHSFFMADLFEGRVRSKSSGYIIFVVHALATGLLFYVVSGILISPTGFAAVEYYLPHIFFTGLERYTLFLAGFLLAILSHIISAFWILLFNKKITQLTQAINLYCWPLLMNIMLIFFIVVLTETNPSPLLILSLAAIFLAVWFFSFNIAAIDGSRQLDGSPFWNLALTVGLHAVVIFSALFWVLFNMALFEPIQLVLHLP